MIYFWPLLIIFKRICKLGKVPEDWKKTIVVLITLQESQEGRSGKAQTHQLRLDSWKGVWATNPGNNFQTHEWQDDALE